MLLNKRRTPFGWRATITKRLLNVGWDGAFYEYACILLASRIDLDRQRPMFLPYDLQEWLPGSHIVHLILDAVEQLPITDFRVNNRGTSSEQYPPRMMPALLIDCYATDRFCSRVCG